MSGSGSRVVISVERVAARWGCSFADIGGWAAMERLTIVTGISPVICCGEEVAGLVEVASADILPLFLREGRSDEPAYLKRIRPLSQKDKWCTVTEPPEGICVTLPDLAILRRDADRFEIEEGLVLVRAGGAIRYDWEQLGYGLVARVAKDGAPPSQSELVRWAQDWFATRGDVPDESTVRRRLMPLWRELQGPA
jgi:hypothetical protein